MEFFHLFKTAIVFCGRPVNGCFYHSHKNYASIELEPEDRHLKLIVGGPNCPTKPLYEFVDLS